MVTEDPLLVVYECLEQFDALMEEAALLAERTKHDAVHLGTINTRFKIMETRFNVMQAAGLIPSMPGVMREVSVRNAVDTVVGFLNARLGDDPGWRRDLMGLLNDARATRKGGRVDTARSLC